jgi:hypothetical protein
MTNESKSFKGYKLKTAIVKNIEGVKNFVISIKNYNLQKTILNNIEGIKDFVASNKDNIKALISAISGIAVFVSSTNPTPVKLAISTFVIGASKLGLDAIDYFFKK